MIAESFNTNHHFIKRILLKNGIKITRRKTLKEYTKEHRIKVGNSRKNLSANGWTPYNKGLKTIDLKNGKEILLKNMKAHLKYDVSLEWLRKFDDIEKLKYLNHSLARQRDCKGFTVDLYITFIEKFYKDKKFNYLFNEWLKTKDKWIKPSLDHIQAKCKGGTLLLENLQFISWLENRAKVDIAKDDWDKMKKNIGYYL